MHARPLEIIDTASLRGGEQRESVVERPGLVLRLCRRQRPLRTPARVRRQCRGALEEGGGGGQATARLGADGGSLQLAGDGLVGGGRRLGQVPGAPVRIELRVGRIRQRPVHLSPLIRRRRPVDRRAHERMAKPDSAVDFDKPGWTAQARAPSR